MHIRTITRMPRTITPTTTTTEALIERSARLEPQLRAWAAFDPAAVRRQARACPTNTALSRAA